MNATYAAAAAVQPGRFGQCIVRADAGRHHHQIGLNLDAVLQTNASDAAVRSSLQRFGIFTQQELHAARFE